MTPLSDQTKIRVSAVSQGGRVAKRAMVMQQDTKTPVQIEMTQQTRDGVEHCIKISQMTSGDYLFPSKSWATLYLSTRQYALIQNSWLESIGIDPSRLISLPYGPDQAFRKLQNSLRYVEIHPHSYTIGGRCSRYRRYVLGLGGTLGDRDFDTDTAWRVMLTIFERDRSWGGTESELHKAAWRSVVKWHVWWTFSTVWPPVKFWLVILRPIYTLRTIEQKAGKQMDLPKNKLQHCWRRSPGS